MRFLTPDERATVALYDARVRGSDTGHRIRRYLLAVQCEEAPGLKLLMVGTRRFRSRVAIKVFAELTPGRSEVYFRDLACRMIAGWTGSWDPVAPERYLDPVDECYANPPWASGITFPYLPLINPEALTACPAFRYCQWRPGCNAPLKAYLDLYLAEPSVEMLAKLGLWELATPATFKVKNRKALMRFLVAHKDEIKARCYGPADIIEAFHKGVTLEEAAELAVLRRDARGYGLALATDYKVDYRRLLRWIKKVQAASKCSGLNIVVLHSYGRYLSYCRELGMDLRDEGTLYPSPAHFDELLEHREAELAARRAAEAKAEKSRLRRAARNIKHDLARYQAAISAVIAGGVWGAGVSPVLWTDHLTVHVATSQKELRAYGKAMHNCVGNGLYWEKMLEGKCIIVRVLKASRPFLCIELGREDGNWRVLQCYGRFNQTPDKCFQDLANNLRMICKASDISASRKTKPRRYRKAA